jgi:hypothetical protein
VAAGYARGRGAEVEGGVEDEGQLDGGMVSVPGLEQVGRPQDQQRRRRVPELESRDGGEHSAQPASQHRPDAQAEGLALTDLRRRGGPDRCQHREGGEQARDDRGEDRRANVERGDEAEREQRPADRSQVVERALESVRAPVRARLHHLGEQRVPGRPAQAPSDPRAASQDANLPRGSRRADQRREHGRRGVPADRRRAAASRVVGQGASREPGRSAEAVGNALDQPERGGRRAERRGEEARQERGRNLVAEIA